MKTLKKLIGIAALVVAIAFSMAACDDGGGGGGGGGGGSGNGFTMTDIPSKYNGKYAMVTLAGGDNLILGLQTYGDDPKLSRISNGRVSVPLWVPDPANDDYYRYSGNETFSTINFLIVNYEMLYDNGSTNTRANVIYQQVKFSNGNATRSWKDGRVIEIP